MRWLGGLITGNPVEPSTSVASGIWSLLQQFYWKARSKWPGQPVETLYDRTTGTNRGDMTLNGGLAAAFDGVTSQDQTASAKGAEGSDTAWIGKTLTAARPASKIVLIGSNNFGFSSGSAGTVTVVLRGKNGSAPASRTDGVSLGSNTVSDANGATITVTSGDTATNYDHIFADIDTGPSGANVFVAEMQIYVMA